MEIDGLSRLRKYVVYMFISFFFILKIPSEINSSPVRVNPDATDGALFVKRIAEGEMISRPEYLMFTAPYKLCEGGCTGSDQSNLVFQFPLFVGKKAKDIYKQIYRRDHKNIHNGSNAPFTQKTTKQTTTPCVKIHIHVRPVNPTKAQSDSTTKLNSEEIHESESAVRTTVLSEHTTAYHPTSEMTKDTYNKALKEISLPDNPDAAFTNENSQLFTELGVETTEFQIEGSVQEPHLVQEEETTTAQPEYQLEDPVTYPDIEEIEISPNQIDTEISSKQPEYTIEDPVTHTDINKTEIYTEYPDLVITKTTEEQPEPIIEEHLTSPKTEITDIVRDPEIIITEPSEYIIETPYENSDTKEEIEIVTESSNISITESVVEASEYTIKNVVIEELEVVTDSGRPEASKTPTNSESSMLPAYLTTTESSIKHIDCPTLRPGLCIKNSKNLMYRRYYTKMPRFILF